MVVKWPADCEAFHCYPLFVPPTVKKWTKKIDTRENLLKSITTSCILYVPVTGAIIIRDITKPRPRRQRERHKNKQLCTRITLFCTFPCLHCTTMTWNDQILSLLGNGNGKAINSTISVRTWARSPFFSSSQNPLLLGNRTNWDNREKG